MDGRIYFRLYRLYWQSIIGAGGIDASGDNTDIVVGTMNWLLEMAFDGWRRNNVADVWSKYRAGKLKSQLKNQ